MTKYYKVVPYLIAISTIFSLMGCASHRFPMVKPAIEQAKDISSKMKAEEYFIRARDYERRGLDQMATKFYEMASQFDPSSMALQQELVRKYIETSNFTQALVLVKGNKKLSDLNATQKELVSTIYLKMGEFAKAADGLESIQEKSLEDIYSLGLIYESLGNTQKALSRYIDYYKDHPTATQIASKIGRLLIRDSRFTEAETLYNDLYKRFGENVEAYSMLGTIKLAKGDTAGALKYFDKALALDSTNEETLRGAAQIFLGRNDYGKAIPYYETLYKNSYYGEIYARTLAVLYFYNNQYKESERLIHELLKNNIDDHELHYYLGLIFESTDRDEMARIEFEKTVTIQNSFEDAWRELCLLSLREKNYDRALQTGLQFTSAVPKSAASWKLLGYVYNVQKNYKAASVALEKAVAIDSSDVVTWFDLGSAYERNKDIKNASAAFYKVLKLKPNDPSTCNYLGYMWAEHNMKLDSAKTLLLTALAKDPENGAFLDSYAWVQFQSGNADSAYSYMMRALKTINNDPVVYAHLGDIHLKRGELKDALVAYIKSIELNADESDNLRKKIAEVEATLRQQSK